MLFKARFHDAIRSGAVTMTIRAWQRPQATPGNEYKLGASERIVVDSVDRITLSKIGPRDARASGFSSVDELFAELRKGSPRSLTARTKVFRVKFHYAGRRADRTPKYSSEELHARLDRMGEWTYEALKLIGRYPGASSAVLAERMDRERLPFKADVRKLKRLGLTQSLEVGYRLTAAGRRCLRGLSRRK